MKNKNEWVVKIPGYPPVDISYLSEKQLNDLKLKIKNLKKKVFLPLYEAKNLVEYRDIREEEEIELAKKSNCFLAVLSKPNYHNKNKSMQRYYTEYIIKLFYLNKHIIFNIFLENLEEYKKLAKENEYVYTVKIVCVDNRFKNCFYHKDNDALIYFCSYEELIESNKLKDQKWIKDKIFVFNHIRYEHLVFLLRTHGIILSGGTHNKRHILSHLEFTFVKDLILFFSLIKNFHNVEVNYLKYVSQLFYNKSFKEKDYSYKNKLLLFIKICKTIFNNVYEKNNGNSRKCRMLYIDMFYNRMDVIVRVDGIFVQPNSYCDKFLEELLNKVEKRIEILSSETNTPNGYK